MALFREQRRILGRWVLREGCRVRDFFPGGGSLPTLMNLPRRILIIRPFFLGDILLCLPLAQAIKHQSPETHLAWLLRDEWRTLLENHSVIDEVISFSPSKKMHPSIASREFLRVVHELRQRSFDLVLNLSWDRSSILWSWFSGAKVRVGIEEYGRPRLLSLLYTTTVIAPERLKDDRPMADFYYEPLRLLGFGPRAENPKVFATKEEQHFVDHRINEAFGNNNPFLLIHPGGRLGYKRWPVDRFAELIQRLGELHFYPLILVCGPGEESWTASLTSVLPRNRSLFWPAPSLGEFIALSSRATLFIGNDSGPMHLAAASGCRVVTIFGNHSSRWGPLGSDHRVFHGGHHLTSVSTESVLEGILEMLKKPRRAF